MPPTEEIECTNDDCELDMFEAHYTYDLPDDFGLDYLVCPYCHENEFLERIEL